jgi:hypothetical protein
VTDPASKPCVTRVLVAAVVVVVVVVVAVLDEVGGVGPGP